MRVQHQLKTGSYKAAGFIGDKQRLVHDTVIPYQYDVLRDRAEDTEKSHVYQNFVNAAAALKGEDTGDGFYGMVFQDSDAAKWIEAAAFSLAAAPDPELERQADDFIAVIAASQDEDGYLDTYFTIDNREKRYTNLLEAHELYCAGHMIEAACAYYEATGKRTLLDAMHKNALHLYDVFITKGHEGFPGHPEVELALMKLYRVTGDERCFELAKHFVDKRGTDPDFYKKELSRRDWQVWGNDASNNEYQQSDKPVRQLENATGHAVRAVYLYTAMADIAAETGERELYDACVRLWNSITRKRMYVTGAIGSTVLGEAFTVDYDLPSDTAYAETCASCGLMFFASRMLENEVKGEYADVMELAFYNTVLAGMQLDGKRFFYVNPLEVIPGISGVSPTHKHDLTTRPKWYACACCPPNVARTIGAFGKYAYGESEDTAYCHMFAAGDVSFDNGMKLECKTGYPYEMEVTYKVTGKGRLAVHIPSWSKKTLFTADVKPCVPTVEDGYAYFDIDGEREITITLDGEPRLIYSTPKIYALTGKACIRRGPLIYCFEGVDNGGCVTDIRLEKTAKPIPAGRRGELDNAVMLDVDALKLCFKGEGLYSDTAPGYDKVTARAIPYYTWGNRGENQMRVWADIL